MRNLAERMMDESDRPAEASQILREVIGAVVPKGQRIALASGERVRYNHECLRSHPHRVHRLRARTRYPMHRLLAERSLGRFSK